MTAEGRKAGRKNGPTVGGRDLFGARSVPGSAPWPVLLFLSGMNLGVWSFTAATLLGLR